jgi:hypothetical protein
MLAYYIRLPVASSAHISNTSLKPRSLYNRLCTPSNRYCTVISGSGHFEAWQVYRGCSGVQRVGVARMAGRMNLGRSLWHPALEESALSRLMWIVRVREVSQQVLIINMPINLNKSRIRYVGYALRRTTMCPGWLCDMYKANTTWIFVEILVPINFS